MDQDLKGWRPIDSDAQAGREELLRTMLFLAVPLWCQLCRARPRKKHHNSKWCHRCAEGLKKRPRGTLTPSQRAFAIRHAGDMLFKEIAKHLGVSPANVKRSCRGTRFYAHNGKYKNRPDLVRQVLEYYFQHGKGATQKAFPHVNVRSITDRPEYYGIKGQRRQRRWTAEEIIEAVQMAGLVSLPAQAKYFARPNANAGAMRSLWVKRFKQGGGSLNGLSWHLARRLVDSKCKPIRTAFWSTRHPISNDPMARKIVLWTDLEKHLGPSEPRWIRDAVKALARFQRWIHKTKNVRPKVIRLIPEREKICRKKYKSLNQTKSPRSSTRARSSSALST